MEVYNIPQHGHADAYHINGAESNPVLRSPMLEQFEGMYNNGASEFAVQQGLYNPSANNLGYISTGMESPSDWNDHQRIFGLDGQEIQYAGSQTENFPYLYYTPGYGYSQTSYNPYNPYIPGAMVGIDGSYIGSQQYYTVPSYENIGSTPGYYPMVVQSGPDVFANSTHEAFIDATASIANRTEVPGFKHSLSSASAAFKMNPSRITSDLKNSFTRTSGGSRISVGPSKQPFTQGSVSSNGYSNAASMSNVFQGRGTQIVNNLSQGQVWSNRNQLKVAQPGNGLSSFSSSTERKTMMDKVETKFNGGSGSSDVSSEQNRGPRTSKLSNQLAVKSHTSVSGESDAQGSIIIDRNLYNKADFPLDYVNAKFFVIKSYSEDDVHKSIKYNVWSSTPNGNRNLYIAYDDARRIAGEEPKGCPIFLFFSVNASGQFCGVAEMTGAVDFQKDVDFWQQDKWSGSFPVKWHIIKDVPNPNFRHIILENNENKPVTNSRDTQEIRYKKGMEMLKIFKHHTSTTSLLDDFMYYENRQKLLKQEKSRLMVKSYENSYILPRMEPPRKLNVFLNLPIKEDPKQEKNNIESNLEKAPVSTNQVLADREVKVTVKASDTFVAINKVEEESFLLKIGSLSINPKKAGLKPVGGGSGAGAAVNSHAVAPAPAPAPESLTAKPVDVVTVGSMPVKVKGFENSVGFMTVGTIPLDAGALNIIEAGLSANSGSRNG
ncbi:YTH domain-containing protein [Heracleum sosnowskyi]|uniref:YTH domain-containing family protein n=1 Tax=Heracleum sosnowskyi TaxID=360622 RepID=A0AAD8IR94_9APIA|nr:YTH domain-containing protein [Heracleum sosnowskyi]